MILLKVTGYIFTQLPNQWWISTWILHDWCTHAWFNKKMRLAKNARIFYFVNWHGLRLSSKRKVRVSTQTAHTFFGNHVRPDIKGHFHLEKLDPQLLPALYTFMHEGGEKKRLQDRRRKNSLRNFRSYVLRACMHVYILQQLALSPSGGDKATGIARSFLRNCQICPGNKFYFVLTLSVLSWH